MEAPAAIDFAVRCPDQLMALVLWIPWTGGGVIASEALRDLAGQRTGDAQDWQIFLRYFATLVHHPASDAEVDADVENLAANMTQADFAVLHRDFDATPDVLPLLPCLTVPTLVMCPRGARMSRPSDAVNIAARIPQGRAVVLDGSLIAPVGDLTEQALSAIDEFLAEFVGRDRKQPPRQLLSEREAQVLCLLARGETNHGVATELVISERTVERHLSNVYTKLGVRGRAEAAAWAVRSGLV
jgi:DNA-binding CsgD family transcriptional regulator